MKRGALRSELDGNPAEWRAIWSREDPCFMGTILTLFSPCMYVCIYGHTNSKSMDQPGKVAHPACGQLNRENEYFPVRVQA